MASHTRQLIDERLARTGRSLAGLVIGSRKKGLGWRKIADLVAEESGVVVSHAAVARWFGDEDRRLGTPRVGVVHDPVKRADSDQAASA